MVKKVHFEASYFRKRSFSYQTFIYTADMLIFFSFCKNLESIYSAGRLVTQQKTIVSKRAMFSRFLAFLSNNYVFRFITSHSFLIRLYRSPFHAEKKTILCSFFLRSNSFFFKVLATYQGMFSLFVWVAKLPRLSW